MSFYSNNLAKGLANATHSGANFNKTGKENMSPDHSEYGPKVNKYF